ncbi:hypothetical protein ZHAS_00009455 [Anopheles sinensis]|uniref:Uncharacterized protein n=1 Tax=Anopheles sinensis TaxID=74873 RepID=A0A084VVA2_ANOSI|nr:hypothetical protein ZHAS_00009455 [Anopheles sinensis]
MSSKEKKENALDNACKRVQLQHLDTCTCTEDGHLQMGPICGVACCVALLFGGEPAPEEAHFRTPALSKPDTSAYQAGPGLKTHPHSTQQELRGR